MVLYMTTHASEIKLTKPDRVHPSRIFHVFLLLYCEYMIYELSSADGRWHFTSEQSVIIQVLGKDCFKVLGI